MNIAATSGDDSSRRRYECLCFRADVRGSLLDLAFLESFVLVISPALLDELEEKLRLKFDVPSEDTAIIRAKLESTAEMVRPDMVLHVITDDPMNRGERRKKNWGHAGARVRNYPVKGSVRSSDLLALTIPSPRTWTEFSKFSAAGIPTDCSGNFDCPRGSTNDCE